MLVNTWQFPRQRILCHCLRSIPVSDCPHGENLASWLLYISVFPSVCKAVRVCMWMTQRVKSCDPRFGSETSLCVPLSYKTLYHHHLPAPHFYLHLFLHLITPFLIDWAAGSPPHNPLLPPLSHTHTHTRALSRLLFHRLSHTYWPVHSKSSDPCAGHYIKQQQSCLFLTFSWIKDTLKLSVCVSMCVSV